MKSNPSHVRKHDHGGASDAVAVCVHVYFSGVRGGESFLRGADRTDSVLAPFLCEKRKLPGKQFTEPGEKHRKTGGKCLTLKDSVIS